MNKGIKSLYPKFFCSPYVFRCHSHSSRPWIYIFRGYQLPCFSGNNWALTENAVSPGTQFCDCACRNVPGKPDGIMAVQAALQDTGRGSVRSPPIQRGNYPEHLERTLLLWQPNIGSSIYRCWSPLLYPAEFEGRNPGRFFKHGDKMAGICKSGFSGNLLNLHSGMGYQKLSGPVDPVGGQISIDRTV